MAIFEITAPDGKTYEVQGNGTEAQALAHFKANWKPSQEIAPQQNALQQAIQEAPAEVNPFEEAMRQNLKNVSPTQKIMGGMLGGLGGETIKNIGALTELASPSIGKPIAQFGQAMTNVSKEANPITGTIGQIGSYVAPTSMLNKAIPSFERLTQAVPKSISLLPEMIRNAGMGGALGFGLTEGTGKEGMMERGKEALINAGLGVGMPIAGGLVNKTYEGGKALLEPLYEKGREAIIGRALREFSGGETNKAIKNLLASKPTVEGSLPTVGQAAGVPSLAATERALQGASPEATNMLANRQTQNALARTNALENIATPSRIDKYTDLRAKLGEDLYEPALQKGMDFSSLTPHMQQQIESLVKAPAIKNAMEKARTNALNRDVDIGNPAGSLRGLHETKMALDQQIKEVEAKLLRDGAGSKSAELDGLRSAKDRLLGFIESPQISPEYKAARETYAKLSKPVNQLEEIAKLADKSVSAKNNTIYTDRFFKELEKVKKDGLLTKQQVNRLEAIGEDLRLKSFAENAGRGVGSNTLQNLAYSNMANQVGVPNMIRNTPGGQIAGNIAKKIGNMLYADANKQITNKMAETMLSPQRAAELMQLQANPNLNTTSAQNLAKMLMLQQTTQGGQ